MAQTIKKRDIESFVKAANRLNAIMERIREYNSQANYYLANDTLNLMKGPSHDDKTDPLRDNVVESVRIKSVGGGDW